MKSTLNSVFVTRHPPLPWRVRNAYRFARIRLCDWLVDRALRLHPLSGGAYVAHAEREFQAVGWLNEKDKMQDLMMKQIVQLLRLFGTHGHSGSSAPYAVRLASDLMMFRPIAPLTGKADEWNEVADGMFQNKRMPSIFKNGPDGEAYWTRGRVFREPNGVCYTNHESRVPVVFPWAYREPEYVDVDEDGRRVMARSAT